MSLSIINYIIDNNLINAEGDLYCMCNNKM